MERQRAVAIAITLSNLIMMSLGTVLSKLALSDVNPIAFTWITVGIGMISMVVYTFGIKRERIPQGLSREVWWYIIAIGVCNFVIGRYMGTLALDRLPATTNTYISNFIGFITMGMSIFILKESPTIFQLLGAGVALFGLRVFFAEIPPANQVVGIAFALIGITAVAYTNNIARKLAIITDYSLSNNFISTMSLLIGGSITVVIGLLADGVPTITGTNNWLILLYSGVLTVAVGLTVWNHILRVLRSYEASVLGGSSVIWTALLAIPILGERLAGHQVAGMALMMIGLMLVQVRRQLPFLARRQPAVEKR